MPTCSPLFWQALLRHEAEGTDCFRFLLSSDPCKAARDLPDLPIPASELCVPLAGCDHPSCGCGYARVNTITELTEDEAATELARLERETGIRVTITVTDA